jgi:dienelactone hydrolase
MELIKLRHFTVINFFALFSATSSAVTLDASDAMLMPHAVMNEQVLSIPGDPKRPVKLQVTVFTPNGPGPFPLAVFNHGANAKDAGAPELQQRYRISYTVDYFLSRGYAVVLPMMRGYAGSEGKLDIRGCDLEGLGIDDAKDIQAVISYMAMQPNMDASRIVVGGQSFGGWNTLAFGALDSPNVKGLINFSGGVAVSRCRSMESRLSIAAGHYGARTHVPSLWFYGDNDHIFPIETWRSMYRYYVAAGGRAELVAYGEFMEDAHTMLNYPGAFRIWVPKVDAFLSKVGLPGKLLYPEYMPTDIPPATHYAGIDDVAAVPYLNDKGRELYQRFLTSPLPRFFAIASNGMASITHGGFDPIDRALVQCRKHGKDCQLYAIDKDVVWIRPTPAPASTHFASLDDQTSVPYLTDDGRKNYLKFLTFKKPRAFVIAPNGSWSAASRGEDPLAQALQLCGRANQGCQLYAVDDAVVWPEKSSN